MKHAAVLCSCIVAVLLSVAWIGRVREGREALAASDAALARGEAQGAILHAQIAASARCPTCTTSEQGFERLERIAKEAETRGDDVTAFAALRATRAALFQRVGFRDPQNERVDSDIARLAHRLGSSAVAAGAPVTPAATEARFRASIIRVALPTAATYAVTGLGALAFLGALVRIFLRGQALRSDFGLATVGAALTLAGVLVF